MSNGCDTEPSLLEYARFHGLADSHLNQDIYAYIPSELLPWPSDVRLPEFDFSNVERLLREPKFQLDSRAVSLLASCLKSPSPPLCLNILSDHRRVKKLKLELPALKTDHGNDMRKLRCRKPPIIAVLNLVPSETEEEEEEREKEGLVWFRQMQQFASSWDKKLAEEKLQTTREVLKALQDTLRPVYTSEMLEAVIADDLAFTKVGHFRW